MRSGKSACVSLFEPGLQLEPLEHGFGDGAPKVDGVGLEVKHQFWLGPAGDPAGTEKTAARGDILSA